MKKAFLLTIGIFLMSVSCLQAQQNSPHRKVDKNGNWGYVDDKGNEVVPCKYNHAYPFYESNLALVESEGKFGYINKQGQVKIPLQYKKAYPFSDDVAAVKKECSKKFGFINSAGKEIIKPNYSDVKWGFIEGYAWVKEGNSWGMINKKGDKVNGFNYSRLSYFDPSTGAADAVTKEGVTHCYLKGKKYSSKREREEAMNPKPRIIWSVIPASTEQSQFALNVKVESKSKMEYCEVSLNGTKVEESNAPGGSSVVEDPKGQESYNITINRTLVLREGENTIRIKVKNSGGEKEDEKTIEFKPNRPVQEKALIVWNDLSSNTIEEHLELDATVKSTVKDVVCRVLLNGAEVTTGTKGSSIVQDSKEIEFKYKLTVIRTLILQEGDNTVKIEVLNAKGKLLKYEQKKIIYVKPMLATIEWGEVPSKTEEEKFALKAQIKSDSEIEYYSMTLNGIRKKGSYIVKDNHNISIDEVFNLREGDNVFKIEVKNKAGEVVEEKYISYTPKEKRIALVIGNADYQNIHFPKLTKTKEDAKAMHALFGSYGFDMRPIVLDADLKKMREAINDFVDEVGKGGYEIALIYYSGHGLSPDGGANYLIPIDANIGYSDEVKHNAINSKTELISRLEEKNCRVEIVLLDCCNDCALAERGTKGAYDGHLVRVDPKPFGISIIHAAQPGKKALEGEGKNSPFVESFIECTRNHPNVGWESFVNDFIIDVKLRTNNYQTPFPEGRIIGEPFFINPNSGK